jgi:hypothetical protein
LTELITSSHPNRRERGVSYVIAALKKCDANVAATVDYLGIARSTYYLWQDTFPNIRIARQRILYEVGEREKAEHSSRASRGDSLGAGRSELMEDDDA